MADGESSSGGIVGGAKRLGHSVLGLLRTRIELFAVELQEEKLRAIELLAWLTVGITLAVAAILLVIGTLALFLWQRAGYAGLMGLAAGVSVAAAGVFLFLRRRIVSGPAPFSGTVGEFQKDMECLRHD